MPTTTQSSSAAYPLRAYSFGTLSRYAKASQFLGETTVGEPSHSDIADVSLPRGSLEFCSGGTDRR